jgi:hypothetical protein
LATRIQKQLNSWINHITTHCLICSDLKLDRWILQLLCTRAPTKSILCKRDSEEFQSIWSSRFFWRHLLTRRATRTGMIMTRIGSLKGRRSKVFCRNLISMEKQTTEAIFNKIIRVGTWVWIRSKQDKSSIDYNYNILVKRTWVNTRSRIRHSTSNITDSTNKMNNTRTRLHSNGRRRLRFCWFELTKKGILPG